MGLIRYGIMQGVSSHAPAGKTGAYRFGQYARTVEACCQIIQSLAVSSSVMKCDSLPSFSKNSLPGYLQVTGTGAGTVAGDGSIIEAAASRFQEIKAEALKEFNRHSNVNRWLRPSRIQEKKSGGKARNHAMT